MRPGLTRVVPVHACWARAECGALGTVAAIAHVWLTPAVNAFNLQEVPLTSPVEIVMTESLSIAGNNLAYEVSGRGPLVVLAHVTLTRPFLDKTPANA